ncbi:GGDEF domain-containing protein (plasmid) [Rhizobium sp. B230/85]|uniref:GGDEF domain-containing protein n=1 Tax=unclassified Rhizobium TaxID=2613769 RepID=UPI001ADC77F3|nr:MULTISPECIES: GGDEF domain-containing protein [unclassified Rhizobium]MBO9134469.1 GGDEF domain-containing protein [Rhizobium sp. B209b/85]QXZ99683.1 GGDEF domain-containing protein [Rhizobium sp. B230/85]
MTVRSIIDQHVKQACETHKFENKRQVFRFAIQMAAAVTIVADILNLAAHLSLNAFGLLPYALVPAAVVGLVISTVVASVLTFSVIYVIGLAIHRLTISRSMFERLSRTDMLSGLLNRRAFVDEVSKAPQDASLVLFDIDQFKLINDSYGHDVGDRAICMVSKQLATALSDKHIVARIGGEEFAVLLVELTPTERLALVERCRQLIEASNVGDDVAQLQVTVSAGIAERGSHETFQSLFLAYDRALYFAKVSGRNRVIHSNQVQELMDKPGERLNGS